MATNNPLLIFDLDGTLYTFDGNADGTFGSSRFYAAIKEKSYAFIAQRLKTTNKQAQTIYQDINKKFDGELSKGMEATYDIDRYDWFARTWDLQPKDFIAPANHSEMFKSLGCDIAVLTAAPRIWAARAIEYLGLANYTQHLYTGEPDLRKPNPAIFTKICDDMGYTPEQTLSIGDQVHSDIIPAKAAGLRTILVRSHSPEADYCVKSIDQLPGIITRLRQ